jgi:NAD+ synthase (glutamine-hydrolysing)
MKNGFIKVAAASPSIRVADCRRNVQQMITIADRASDLGVKLLVFPELSITSASCGDLFKSSSLLSGALDALNEYIDATAESDIISVVGLPYKLLSDLYNCAVVCAAGSILGVVAKSRLTPAQSRVFTSGDLLEGKSYCFFQCAEDRAAALGTKISFAAIGRSDLSLEVCFVENDLLSSTHG